VVIRDLAKKDKVVLLGRGAQFILEDDPNALHILLVGEHEDRVEFIRKNYDLTAEQAEEVVTDGEKRRRQIYSLFGKSDYNDTLHYHLALNTSRLPQSQVFEQMVALVRQFEKRGDSLKHA
jgi:cytidylate kinase